MATPASPALEKQLHRKAHIGTPTSFWLHSSRTGFDLTRAPSTPSLDTAPAPRLTIHTTTSPITLSPATTALLVIDMQNFFLSPSLGRSSTSPGHLACENLVKWAVPAARRAGIRVVWVNWGLTAREAEELPPGVRRAFGFWSVPEDPVLNDVIGKEGGEGAVVAGGEVEREQAMDEDEDEDAKAGQNAGRGLSVDKHGNERKSGFYSGIGNLLGSIVLDSGETIDGGRLLMRGSWNADLYPPLRVLFDHGKNLTTLPDVWMHKNRMSALWGATTPLQRFLEQQGITTLLFAGVNTDQCVGGTLTDAFSKGYDCVLLSDACGTSSPGFAQECWEYNAANTFGFCTSCEKFAKGVGEMRQ